MRVLVVTSLYPPHSLGGYEASCRDVVERWRASGADVSVLTTATRLAGVADDPAEVGVRRELEFWWDDHVLRTPGWRERVAVTRRNGAALARALDEVRPDVVSAWSMGALSLSLLSDVAAASVPLVLVVCDDWLVYGERADPWRRGLLGRPLRAALARRLTGLPVDWPPASAAHAVYVSEAVRARATAEARWVPATSAVVTSGMSREDFPLRPAEERPWRGRLLCVGRIDPRKGLDVAVRALADLPGCTLEVVGEGDRAHLAELQALAAPLGDRVVFRGRVPRSSLADVYAGADALLFPVTWDEPFGLVPLEAMACATPVVATGTGGSAAQLRDGDTALLVPPGDPAALAAAVRRLAAEPDLRRRLVAGGLVEAARHDVATYAERLMDEHERVLR